MLMPARRIRSGNLQTVPARWYKPTDFHSQDPAEYQVGNVVTRNGQALGKAVVGAERNDISQGAKATGRKIETSGRKNNSSDNPVIPDATLAQAKLM